jgi:hypothetical protein
MLGAPFASGCSLYKFIRYDNLMNWMLSMVFLLDLQISINPCTFYTSILW